MKILILFCGGTLIMEENRDGVLVTPPQERALENLLKIESNLKNVAELENAGLVKRSSGDDRRFVMVKVTPKGEKLVAKIQKHLQEFHTMQYKNLSNAERYLLDELLIKISHIPQN